MEHSGPRASRQSQLCRPFDEACSLQITIVNNLELPSCCLGAMFILTQLEEDVRIQPSDLSLPPLEAVTDVIERRFLDKVFGGPNMHASTCILPCIPPMRRTCHYRSWSACYSCATPMYSHALPCTPMHPQAPSGTAMHPHAPPCTPMHPHALPCTDGTGTVSPSTPPF